jgi:hypothetical protein
MSPTEFGTRMSAADQRFARARERDDISEMRAALAEKTALLKSYYGVPQRGSENLRSA